jgi:hypothetical protein
VDSALRCRNTHLFEQRDRAATRFLRSHREVRADGLLELAADGEQRVERRQRILEDGTDPATADRAQLPGRQAVDAPSFETDLTCRDARRRIEQAQHRRTGDGLAGTGLTHHAQHFAGCDVEGHVVHRHEHAPARHELHAQIAHREQRAQGDVIPARAGPPQAGWPPWGRGAAGPSGGILISTAD